MRNFRSYWLLLALVLGCAPVHAGTLTVSTTSDEENCRHESGCTTLDNSSGEMFPVSTGCSLREAVLDVEAAARGQTQPYPECGTADPGSAIPLPPGSYTNTIDLAGMTINVNAPVSDPGIDQGGSPPPACASDSPVPCPIQYGEIERIGSPTDSPGWGTLLITGGSLTCTDSGMLYVNPNGDLTLSGISFSLCTHNGAGLAVTDQDDGNLTLLGVTFTGIHSTSDSLGGCIQHGTGNLVITGGAFSGCIVDNNTGAGGLYPLFGGGTSGKGGAISISSVNGGQKHVLISGVAFSGNVASFLGGAIYVSGADAVVIDTSTFEGNFAFGDSTANPSNGGGAIFAEGVAMGNIPNPPTPPDLYASDFLLFQDNFTKNIAVNGSGGAISLSNGNLTWGSVTLDLGGSTKLDGLVPGGVVASNFSGNDAQGQPSGDGRSGSGGAIYAGGSQLAVLDSSFVADILGANSSSSGSGGAIAYSDPSAGPPLIVYNTTFNGNNAAVSGGAIADLFYSGTNQAGKVTLTNVTMSGNTTTAAAGGGNFFNGSTTVADVNVNNTIFDAGGTSNCGGQPFTGANNIQNNPNSDCSSSTAGDPMLKSASIFSGPNILVFTMDLNSGSAASGTGNQTICAASPVDDLDESVRSRPQGKPNCDIGAYESAIVADMTLAMSHLPASFTRGDAADTYTLTATNGGDDSTDGTITVIIDALPAGDLSAVSLDGGADWACTLGTLTCTYTKVLASGAGAPPITLTVSVAPNAPDNLVTPTAHVSGGDEANTGNDDASSPTDIVGGSTPVRLQSFEVD